LTPRPDRARTPFLLANPANGPVFRHRGGTGRFDRARQIKGSAMIGKTTAPTIAMTAAKKKKKK
jgi:hypothetical protein